MHRLLGPLLGLTLASVALELAAPAAPTGAAEPPAHNVTLTGAGVSTYPAYDPAIDRYAVRTGSATDGALTVTASTSDPGGTISVDGRPVASGEPLSLAGLSPGDEVAVSISDSAGTTHQSYVVLPAGFPEITATGVAAATPGDVFLGLGSFLSETSFETVVDNRGVPVHVRETLEPHDFRPQDHGPAYTVFEPVKDSPDDQEYGYRVRELDARYRTVATRRLAAVPALGVVPDDTDFHDVVYTGDDRVVLVGYHRDFREDGTPWLDAVIQVTDLAGQPLFTWTSKGHVDPGEAYVRGGKGQDYAHINSVQVLANGDLLASFRNLGQVLRIATTAHDGFAPGDVIWRMGGERNEFTFLDDPAGGFCAQHAAQVLPNGHLLLFDNGSRQDTEGPIARQTADMCPDPANPDGPRIARPQTRVVEYALDEAARTARLVWSHVPQGRYAAFAGNAQRLVNGNTLVGWSSSQDLAGPTPAPVVSEVTQDHAEPWSLTAPGWFSYRAFRGEAPDAEAPEVEIDGLEDGHAYPLGSDRVVTFTCTDRGGSNLQSCTGDAAYGSTVHIAGSGTFTVTATDGAGNTTSRTVHYGAVVVEDAMRADLEVRKPGGPWHGTGRFGGALHQQVVYVERNAGPWRTAFVRGTNTSHGARSFVLAGKPGNRAFAVRYLYRGRDITREVVAGTFTTPRLAPGEGWRMRIDVRRTRHAADGTERRTLLTARSGAGLRDSVAVVVRAR